MVRHSPTEMGKRRLILTTTVVVCRRSMWVLGCRVSCRRNMVMIVGVACAGMISMVVVRAIAGAAAVAIVVVIVATAIAIVVVAIVVMIVVVMVSFPIVVLSTGR